jgi:hypothetical protein
MQAKFQVKRLAVAVGAALASGAAFALPPGDYNPTDTEDVYISGASALQASFNAALARLCIPGTLDKYNAGSNYEAYFCSVAAGTYAGQTKNKLVLHKSSDKGSGNGVIPLLGTGVAVPFINFANTAPTIAAACSATALVASVTIAGDTLGVPSYINRTCTSTASLITTVVRPDGGVSDVEPPIFSTQDTSAITAAAPSAVVFGFIVSTNLYRSLQAAQGKDSTTTANDTTVDTTVTGVAVPIRDNEANMPSLTRDQIASLFSGVISNWSQLKTPTGANLASLPTDATVYLARRVPSSGTQKASEIFLFGGTGAGADDNLGFVPPNAYPAACNSSAIPMATSPVNPAADAETVCSASGQAVFNGSGTGNVRNCVTNHNTGGRWAIGIASTESSFAATNGWRFIKVDGFAPSLLNVVKNNYKNWTTVSTNKPAYFADLSAPKQGAVDTVLAELGDLTVVRAINNSFRQVWGQGAYLALPDNGETPTALASLTQANLSNVNPVHYMSKSLLGSANNCQLPLVFPGQPHPVQ